MLVLYDYHLFEQIGTIDYLAICIFPHASTYVAGLYMSLLNVDYLILLWMQEFEPLISRPYSIVYFHSAATLQL